MARKTARIGWVPMISRARSNTARSPALIENWSCEGRPSSGPTARRPELFDHAVHQVRGRRRRIVVFVAEPHRLPFELTELMKRLHLDPRDVLHGRNEP